MPRALLSVFDKTGVVDFARALHDLGWELLSSGGTAKVIADAGIPVIDVATVTGYPAILGHRVVTLHPSIHGALLADTDNAEHVARIASACPLHARHHCWSRREPPTRCDHHSRGSQLPQQLTQYAEARDIAFDQFGKLP